MPANVVICYADADKNAAETLCAGLEAAGLPCWIAPRDLAPNDPPDQSLTAAIAQARIIVLVVSKHANESKSVEREMELAIATDSTPCPVRIEDVPLSDPLTLLVGTVQWFDAIAPPLEQHVDAIAAALKSFLSRPPPIMRAAPESMDRPISIQTAERWNPATLDQLRVQQREAVATRMQQFRLHKPALACSAAIRPHLLPCLDDCRPDRRRDGNCRSTFDPPLGKSPARLSQGLGRYGIGRAHGDARAVSIRGNVASRPALTRGIICQTQFLRCWWRHVDNRV
jgi:hypothetical protein